MTPEESLRIVLDLLEESGIFCMLTGSFASNIHGIPRTTQDADIVIEPDAASLDTFVARLGEGFYADEGAAREAFDKCQIFNAIHYETGFKVDLIIRKPRPFSREEFSRREAFTFLGRTRWFATAEDTILAKLEWSQAGSSERQFEDAVGIAKVQGDKLDTDYLRKWAQELGVIELLEKLLQETGRNA
jgi:hypothetical protein